MIIKSFKLGEIKTNCYLVFDKKTKDAIVIDPGFVSDELLNEINSNDLSVKYIVITHGHWDHISGASWLRDTLNTKILTHEKSRNFLMDHELNFSKMLSGNEVKIVPDKYIVEDEIINIGRLKFKVIHTPGHTPGCISLYEQDEKVLFSGDLLFKSTIGRTDLPGGDFHTLIESLKDKILKLPDNVCIYPGHGAHTTIGHERYTNNFLK